MNRQHGLSLIELLVTLAVLGIGLMMAVPSFTKIVNSNRTTSETNALVGALSYARSEATKRGATVSVCTSNNGTTCTTGIGWNSGWIVFVNTDNDSPAQVDSGETILRVYGKIMAGSGIDASAALADSINYRGDGFSNAQGQFVYCDKGGAAGARTITVSRTGRLSLSTGGGTCSAS